MDGTNNTQNNTQALSSACLSLSLRLLVPKIQTNITTLTEYAVLYGQHNNIQNKQALF